MCNFASHYIYSFIYIALALLLDSLELTLLDLLCASVMVQASVIHPSVGCSSIKHFFFETVTHIKAKFCGEVPTGYPPYLQNIFHSAISRGEKEGFIQSL